MAEVVRIAPAVKVTEFDIVRDEARAFAEGIRSTPTVIVHDADGAEVFRAEGVPTIQQVLVAAAKGL
jgi:hypothetical protein